MDWYLRSVGSLSESACYAAAAANCSERSSIRGICTATRQGSPRSGLRGWSLFTLEAHILMPLLSAAIMSTAVTAAHQPTVLLSALTSRRHRIMSSWYSAPTSAPPSSSDPRLCHVHTSRQLK